jgi:hypothetical protein
MHVQTNDIIMHVCTDNIYTHRYVGMCYLHWNKLIPVSGFTSVVQLPSTTTQLSGQGGCRERAQATVRGSKEEGVGEGRVRVLMARD